jgi:general secretion pathway protein J
VSFRNKSVYEQSDGFFLKPRGFTLLEILLAVFIFGIIMTTLFGSFNAIFGQVSTMETRASGYDSVKTCLDRMVEDLSSLYITPSDLYPLYSSGKTEKKSDIHRVLGETATAGEKRFSRLRFSSWAHLPLEGNIQKGVAQILYYVQNVEGRYLLKRADTLYPYPSLEEYPLEKNNTDPVLCVNVQSFSIVYLDHEGKEYESWDSDSEEFAHSTPKAIGIKLTLGEGEEQDSIYAETRVLLPVSREKKEP